MDADANVEFVKNLFAALGRGVVGYFIEAHVEDAENGPCVRGAATCPSTAVDTIGSLHEITPLVGERGTTR